MKTLGKVFFILILSSMFVGLSTGMAQINSIGDFEGNLVILKAICLRFGPKAACLLVRL
jgi:hypothetical protein